MLKLHLFQGACVVPFAEDTATSCASSETQRPLITAGVKPRESVKRCSKRRKPKVPAKPADFLDMREPLWMFYAFSADLLGIWKNWR